MSWPLASFSVLAVALAAGFAWYEHARPSAKLLALVATLAALAAQGDAKPELVTDALARYDIDPDAVNPYLV